MAGELKPRKTRCKACNAEIFFALTEKGNKMPLDAKRTKVVQVVIADKSAVVTDYQEGHVPHHVTCPRAGDFRSGRKPSQPAASQEGTGDQDVCPECGGGTGYREWAPPHDDKVLEFWDCRKKPACGRWWKTKGTNYVPKWKSANPERQAEVDDEMKERAGTPGEDVPF